MCTMDSSTGKRRSYPFMHDQCTLVRPLVLHCTKQDVKERLGKAASVFRRRQLLVCSAPREDPHPTHLSRQRSNILSKTQCGGPQGLSSTKTAMRGHCSDNFHDVKKSARTRWPGAIWSEGRLPFTAVARGFGAAAAGTAATGAAAAGWGVQIPTDSYSSDQLLPTLQTQTSWHFPVEFALGFDSLQTETNAL
eukprot:COSAG02_NODE_24681_length_680_cov_1.201377_1_plen_192_part_10